MKGRILFGYSVEERSRAIDSWKSADTEAEFSEVVSLSDYAISVESGGVPAEILLRDQDGQAAFWRSVRQESVVIDITGLNHPVWAALLRGALRSGKTVAVTYAEPGSYAKNDAPTEGEIYDLSERIEGIRPMPGFASLAPDSNRRTCIPLLGFEGTRFKHILSVLEPDSDRVIPIIGVPGFRIDYPFNTYRGNRVPLLQSGTWKECRFAAANCPFSALYELIDLDETVDPDLPIAVALIGTKPHALGAVLYYLSSDRDVEIVYDHPVRKPRRSSGSTTVSLYDLEGFALDPSKI